MHSLIDSIVPDALSLFLSDGPLLLLRRWQPFSGWLAMTRNIRHALFLCKEFSSLPVTVSLPRCFRCARVCFSPAPLPLTSADCTLFLCLCLPVSYIFDWKWTICYSKLRLSLCVHYYRTVVHFFNLACLFLPFLTFHCFSRAQVTVLFQLSELM